MVSGAGPRADGAPTELERIRSTVAAHFPVYETRIGPQSLLLAVHVDRAVLEERFDRLRRALGADGYVPLLRREAGEEFIEVVRRPRARPRGLWVNAALLVATLGTTVFAGALIWMVYSGEPAVSLPDVGAGGLFFALPLMTILGVHELAHFWAARRRHLDASLPFFLPVPPPLPFGTFGAFVSIRDPFPDRKAMFDVSASGPIAGFLVSIPVSLGGLYLSERVPSVAASYCAPTVLGLNYGHLLFSPSLLWSLLGSFFPGGGAGLHPLAIAGWVGILVTSINLLPIGSLDGGRVFRALLGDRARWVSYAAALLLFGLSIFYAGWFLFGVLVLILGLRNPPPLNDLSPLGPRRTALGAVVAAVLVAGFVVVPIQLPPGQVGVVAQSVVPTSGPPGTALSANLTAVVSNGDPVAHAIVVSLAVENVTIQTSTGLEYLNASQRALWGQDANWTVFLPGGGSLVLPSGPSASMPASDALQVPAHADRTVVVAFSNGRAAAAVLIGFTAQELCPPAGGGSAATQFVLTTP